MEEEKRGHSAMHSASWRSRLFAYLVPAVIYLAIALIMFYPLTLHMGYVAPGTGGDTYQNLWDIWWVNYALLNLHSGIYFTNILFWPLGVSLVYQTMPPLTALISAPFQALGVVFTYNTMFFLGFVLSGITMFILADYLVKNRYAAFIAGLIFTFSTFHIAQSYAHLHFINIEWVPLFAYFMLRVLREKRSYFNIIGMGASFALATLMGNIEQSIMLILLLVAVVIIYILHRPTRHNIISLNFVTSMVLFLVIAFVIGSWSFVPLLGAVLKPGGLASANALNTVQYNLIWSHDLLALFVPSYYNGLLSSISSAPGVFNTYFAIDPTERVAYIGFVAMLLSLFALYRYKRHLALWLVLAIVFGWLTLGPLLQVGGSLTPVPGLYYLYRLIPFLNIVREPGRFDLIFTIALAVLAAFGAKAVIERFHASRGRSMALAITIVLSLLILIESNGAPLSPALTSHVATLVAPSPAYYSIAQLRGNFSVLELPALPLNASQPALYTGMATYYTTITHKPLVGGYVTRENLSDEILLYNMPLIVETSNLLAKGTASYESPVNQNYTAQTLMTLYNYNTAFIVVMRSAFNQTQQSELINYLYAVFGSPVYPPPNIADNTTMVFQTSRAVNQSAFKTYVAYPIPTQWQETVMPYNGTSIKMWVPVSPGDIEVFAPYFGNSTTVNTKIRFSAISNGQASLYIDAPSATGQVSTIARINATGKLQNYSVSTTMTAGIRGNILYFVENPSTPVFITNITFSNR